MGGALVGGAHSGGVEAGRGGEVAAGGAAIRLALTEERQRTDTCVVPATERLKTKEGNQFLRCFDTYLCIEDTPFSNP